MKYHVCVSIDEYYEADIEADTQEEAEDKAFNEFEKQNKVCTIDCYPIIEPRKRTRTSLWAK